MTSTENLKEMIVKAGGDVSALPDNLETTLYKALCDTLGVDYSDMTDNLLSSYRKEIINEYTGGTGGGGGDEASVLDSLIDGSLTEITSNATSVREYVFYRCTQLTTVNIPLATSILNSAFYECTSLTTADFPLATSIGNSAFNGCTRLTTADFPLTTSIGASVFYGCTRLTTVILRSENMCSLNNVTAFKNTPIASGTGYIYVPKSLIEDYKVATNWSTFATQFRALEDYTVDGTITGELDESKI